MRHTRIIVTHYGGPDALRVVEEGCPEPKNGEIAGRAGTSRTRVTAIANGNTQGISTDLLIRVLSATGHKAELRIRKAAA